MSSSSQNRRRWLGALAAVVVLAGAAAVIASGRSGPRHSAPAVAEVGTNPPPTGGSVLRIEQTAIGRPIPPGFVGLSIEFRGLEQYAGPNPDAVNPIFVQLIRNLAPGQRPVLRVGGDSTDWSWWPVPDMRRPPGIRYVLTPRWVRTTRAIAQATGARLILGINLEAGRTRIAAVEARALVDGLGRQSIDALEIGNEPELYPAFGWYTPKGGRPVHGRPRGYDFADFTTEFSRYGAALPRVPLAGPATGAAPWIKPLNHFLSAEPRVGVATVHLYPLQRCGTRPTSPMYPTLAHLLSASSTRGLAERAAPYVAVAHAHGVRLRIDEMNSVSCGSVPTVSRTFGSALWALGALFAVARVGVDGVNIHTYPGGRHELFRFFHRDGHWQGLVNPEYYGLLMFAEAAPPGSRLLALAGSPGAHVTAWATRATNGQIRVVLINDGAQTRVVAVRPPPRAGAATLERLQAPSVHANTGVTLGGQSFGTLTDTGALAGAVPTASVASAAGDYRVAVPGTSAAMLTFTAPR
jgi:hypothetical protein